MGQQTTAKRMLSLFLAWLMILSLGIQPAGSTAFATEAAEISDGNGVVAHQLLVKFIPGVDATTKKNAHTLANGKVMGKIDRLQVDLVQTAPGQFKAALESYQKNKNVLYAEYDPYLTFDATPNDPKLSAQAVSYTASQAPAAWELATGSTTMTIAVIDSGIDAAHPEFAGRLVPGYNFYADNTDVSDQNGHGTKVSGIIMANANNGTGIAGINWNSGMMPLKVSDSGDKATASTVAKAIVYAADHSARVISISMSTPIHSATLKSAVEYAENKGAVVVASAGNQDTAVAYPAAYPTVLGVGALNPSGTRASGSNYGSGLDVGAVGHVYTTLKDSGYGFATGTSSAAPQAAGLASLILSVDSQLTPFQVREIIKSTAKNVGLWNEQTGYGQVNMPAALQAAGGTTTSPTPHAGNAPTPAVQPEDQQIVDVTPPVIHLNGVNTTVLRQGDAYTDPGATATDDIDGNLTPSITISGAVDTVTAGIYKITYSATDAAGNTAVETRTVSVVEPDAIVNRPAYTFSDVVGAGSRPAVTYVLNSQTADPGTMDVVLTFAGTGRTLLELTLYDSQGNTIQSMQTLTTCIMSVPEVSGGTYKLVIKALNATVRVPYTLNVMMPVEKIVTIDDPLVPLGKPQTEGYLEIWIAIASLILIGALGSWIYIRRHYWKTIE